MPNRHEIKNDHIYVERHGYVPVYEVSHLESDTKYTKLHRYDGKLLLSCESMVSITKRMPQFMVIHRGVAVRKSLMTEVIGTDVHVKDAGKFKVSRREMSAVLEAVKENQND